MYRGKVPANAEIPLQYCLTGPKLLPTSRSGQKETTDAPRVRPDFTSVHEENEYYII